MTKKQPKYRRPLNNEQLEVLQLLYRFRFVTTELLAQYQNKPKASAVYSRLKVLVEQEYIGRTYDKSYKLLGKPASYHILPKGIQLLKDRPEYDEKVLHAMYRDRTASEQFIERCLATLGVFNVLYATYGGSFDMFSKSELAEFDYFPDNKPDAYISLKPSKTGKTKHYILVIFQVSLPHFAALNRIKELIEHADTGEWDEPIGGPPVILGMCETIKQQKALQPRIARMDEVEASEDRIYLTSQEQFFNGNLDIWQKVDDPITLKGLPKL